MNFVESMEEIIEILQASENGEIGCKVKFWSGHKVHEQLKKIF
jgi:hypothetical protein